MEGLWISPVFVDNMWIYDLGVYSRKEEHHGSKRDFPV